MSRKLTEILESHAINGENRPYHNEVIVDLKEAEQAILQWHTDELKKIRDVYDKMELRHEVDTMEQPHREFVTWRGWKMVRNVITDRIEELTGKRT